MAFSALRYVAFPFSDFADDAKGIARANDLVGLPREALVGDVRIVPSVPVGSTR